MRSFIVFLCFIPVLLFSCRSVSLETQLKEAIKDRKAEIGIAVIIDEKDTVTVNNDIHYPLMSVFKFSSGVGVSRLYGETESVIGYSAKDREIGFETEYV